MTSARARLLLPALASAAVATAVAAALAWALAPRYDELHTLSHLDHPDLRSLATSYRRNRDTLPIAGYALFWSWARVAGSGLLAARVPVVASWGILAGSLSIVTRRIGPWASLVAGIVPSATALVFLGAFARPYAPALAATAVGLVAWQRAGEVDRAWPWLGLAVVAFGLGGALHTALAVVPPVVAGLTWWPPGAPRRRGRAAAAVLGAALPLLLGARSVSAAVRDQGRLPRSAGPSDALAFWPSALRPALPVLVVGGLLAAACRLRRGRPTASDHPTARPPDRSLRRLGLALAILVPPATVLAMALTSGVYVHRYAMGALLGAGLLSAGGVGWCERSAPGWSRRIGPAFAVLALAAAAAASVATRHSMVATPRVEALAHELAAEGRTVFVRDEYDAALLRWGSLADPRSASWADIGAARAFAPVDVAPTIAGSAPSASLADLLADPRRSTVDLVVPAGEVGAVLDEVGPDWHAEAVATVSYERPGGRRTLVRLVIDRGGQPG